MEAAIILNSPNLNREIEEPFIVVADGGLKNLNKRIPDVIIGDFDSIKKPEFKNVIQLNPIKDSTDSKECLDYIIKNGYKSVAIYGIGGGRLDHQLCNLSLIISAYKRGLDVVGYDDYSTIYYLEEGSYIFKLEKGTEFSLISFCDESIFDKAKGTKYPLDNLHVSKENLGRAISNVSIEDTISFDILKGCAFIFINDKK